MNDKLKLGVSTKIITPEIGGRLMGYRPDLLSESVNDDLTATAMVFSQGDKKALMLSIAVCVINSQISADIRGKIEKEYGIPAEHCIVHTFHTHSGPCLAGTAGWGDVDTEYLNKIFMPNVMAAVGEAIGNMTEVKMGVSSGMSYVASNRRELTIRNTVKLGQNPWGPFNPEMTVISFKDESGKNVASMVHYGCHATASGMNKEVTRDWPGVMTDVLAEISEAPAAFFNGPEGDVGPRLTNGSTTGRQKASSAMEIGAVAAQDAVRIYRDIRAYHDVTLDIVSDTIELPLEPLMDYESAKELYEQNKEKTVNLRAKQAEYARQVMELHESGYENKTSIPVKQTIIRLGDVAFVSFPYEMFSEIGMRIARESNIPRTLSLSLTNGSDGYFVTEDQICRGGYEVESFKTAYIQPYADNADWHMVTETLKNLKKFDNNVDK